MCGIFGHIGSIPEHLAVICTNTLSHRGPDGKGIECLDGITLGHRRLAILDLSEQGKQPMSYANGRYWITYNGEIYNFLEIRSELESRGHVFRSQSDTEVILAAFAEWGAECLNRFNGMWAFAIWDIQEKILFLSRDRFGKKPLFYADLPGGFAFASEMKAIFPLLSEVWVSEDFKWMSKNIFLYETTDKCLIKGIKRFPSGHYGIYRNSTLILHRYWNTLDNMVKVPQSYDEQVERFRELFLDSCCMRMRSDVPIGTALSGGLDSSATICAMAYISKNDPGMRISRDWQHAFVATFPGTPLDESYYAKKVVDHLGIPATFINIDPAKSMDKLEEYLYLFEELYITSPIPMIQTYGVLREKGVVVTLDGHGADELFAGYGASLLEAFPDCGFNISSINEIAETFRELFPRDSLQLAMKHGNAYLYMRYMMANVVKTIIGRKMYEFRDLDHLNFTKLDNFNKHLYLLTNETILPTLLRNYDRYSMINGVEIRMPFMDHRIVTYSLSLPWDSKTRDGFTKKIVRDALAPFMPEEVAYRKTKIGFNSPIVDWMKHQMKDYLLDMIHSRQFEECPLIDTMRVRKQVEKVICDEKATYLEGEKAWTDLVPYLWEKAVIKKKYSWN